MSIKVAVKVKKPLQHGRLTLKTLAAQSLHEAPTRFRPPQDTKEPMEAAAEGPTDGTSVEGFRVSGAQGILLAVKAMKARTEL